MDSGPTCEPDLRLCEVEFRFPFGGERSVELRGDFGGEATWAKGLPLSLANGTWRVSVKVPYAKPVAYKYLVDGVSWRTDPTEPKTVSDGLGGVNSLRAPEVCATFSCAEPPPPPDGVFDWRDAVIYFAFVDRFFDGDAANNCHVTGVDAAGDYKGGDWKGVTAKIQDGYFDRLGVNVLWITVPVQNTAQAGRGIGGDPHLYSAYHGYWPTELDQTETCFGTEADLVTLVSEAHKKNIRVLFDYAMVHVHSSSSVYAAHPDWFWPNEFFGRDCLCGQGCDWNAQGDRCWFTDYLPHWNYQNVAARNYAVSELINLLMKTSADGLRVDAIKHVDPSWLLDARARIQREIVPRGTPPQRFYMVGETYDFGNRPYLKSFIDPNTKLDGQFDFPLRLELVRAMLLRQSGMNDLASFMASNDGFYGVDAVMSTWVGNHDLGRVIHLAQDPPLWTDPYSDGKNFAWSGRPTEPTSLAPFERLANAFAVLFTNRGAPLIYYGDEVGLAGAGDPDNRREMPWSGLSSHQTWLRDRLSTLLKIRASHPALRRGSRQTVTADADLWVYTMATSGDTVIVAINRGDVDRTANGLPAGVASELVTGSQVTGPTFTVPARQTRILVSP